MDRPLSGVQGYKRLVRILARILYAGDCPPKEMVDEDTTTKSRFNHKNTFIGLGIILLDYMVSSRIDGYVEESTIASDLRLSLKNVRKALRYLESEHIVSSESVKISLRRQNAILSDDPEVEEKKRQETRVFWCVDFPRLRDVVRLRLSKIREALRRRITEAAPLQEYICRMCGSMYSSLDAARLIDPTTLTFRCEECRHELEEHVQGAEHPLGSHSTTTPTQSLVASSRREAEAYYKDLQKRFEAQLKPLIDQAEAVRETDPPDYGSLQDWYARKKAEAERRQKRIEAARKRAGGMGSAMTEDELLDWADRADVAVALEGSEVVPGGELKARAVAREVPAWFQLQEETGGSRGEGSEEAAGGAEAVDEERKKQEEAYLRQYLAQVQAVQALGHELEAKKESRPPKKEEEKEEVGLDTSLKRVKTEDGWVASALVRKEEKQEHPLSRAKEEEEEELAWEDAE